MKLTDKTKHKMLPFGEIPYGSFFLYGEGIFLRHNGVNNENCLLVYGSFEGAPIGWKGFLESTHLVRSISIDEVVFS